jgi:hypothetical protein
MLNSLFGVQVPNIIFLLYPPKDSKAKRHGTETCAYKIFMLALFKLNCFTLTSRKCTIRNIPALKSL